MTEFHRGFTLKRANSAYSPIFKEQNNQSLVNTIERMAQMDLENKTSAYQDWLIKKEVRKSNSIQHQSAPKIKDIDNLTNEEIDELIKKLEKNKMNYENWLIKKNKIENQAKLKQIEKSNLLKQEREKREIEEKNRQKMIKERVDGYLATLTYL